MARVRMLLKALTAEMDLSFRGPTLEVVEFPFRVGRECRATSPNPRPSLSPERRGGTPRNNDLYILETGSRLFVSRQHLLIEARDSGFCLMDLFSACGTIVEGRYVGGDHKGGEVALEHQDIVVVGTSNSPYMFKVMLL